MPYAHSELDSTDLLYRFRFEAAEERYAKMKARVHELEEQQQYLVSQTAFVQNVHLLRDVPCNPAMWDLISELKTARSEIERLSDINRSLRTGVAVTMPEPAPMTATSVIRLEAELATAVRKIGFMDMELARMNDLRFEDDLLMREYEAAWDCLVGREAAVDTSPIPSRFLPVPMCQDASCKAYVGRLRNGMRQAVAEVRLNVGCDCLCTQTCHPQAYVRDRGVRIHGFFRQHVQPLEQLRAEKDAEIECLRLRLARLECASFRTAGGVDPGEVDAELVAAVMKLERMRTEQAALTEECDTLRAKKSELAMELAGLQAEVEEARHFIDESSEKHGLCMAATHMLEREKREAERIWRQIKQFKEGKTAVEYERRMQQLERVEREIDEAERRLIGLKKRDAV